MFPAKEVVILTDCEMMWVFVEFFFEYGRMG